MVIRRQGLYDRGVDASLPSRGPMDMACDADPCHALMVALSYNDPRLVAWSEFRDRRSDSSRCIASGEPHPSHRGGLWFRTAHPSPTRMNGAHAAGCAKLGWRRPEAISAMASRSASALGMRAFDMR